MQDVKISELLTSTVAVPVGTTLGVLVDNTARQGNIMLQVATSGGSLSIVGVATGVTLAGATLAPLCFGGASQAAFLISSVSGVITINGPARFYMASAGITLQVAIAKGLVSQA
jgi:hypothetical protein